MSGFVRDLLRTLAPTPEAAYALGLLLFFVFVPILARGADWMVARLERRSRRP